MELDPPSTRFGFCIKENILAQQPRKQSLTYNIPFLNNSQAVVVMKAGTMAYKIICRDGFWKVLSFDYRYSKPQNFGTYDSYQLCQDAIEEREKERQ